MINVPHARAALMATPGEVMALSKAQIAEMLDEVETGQHARRALINLKPIAVAAVSASGPTS